MVEVLGVSNTVDEIEEKLGEYFDAGVEIVWVIYPKQKTVHVHTSPTQISVLQHADELDGGTAIPGFRVKLAEVFAVPHGA